MSAPNESETEGDPLSEFILKYCPADAYGASQFTMSLGRAIAYAVDETTRELTARALRERGL